jgi:Tfp pilus assembly protein PilF
MIFAGCMAANPSGRTETTGDAADLPQVARLGCLDEARSLAGRGDFVSAWNAVVAAIQTRPFHPEAWLLLAEIALAAGDSTSARKCARHAAALAPKWKAPKEFLKMPLAGNARPDWIKLPEADHPTSDLRHPVSRLTVCLIAKNEEQFIARCLASVKTAASQIIVVDTGSSDRTVEIAKANGAEVHCFDWCDDFSAARNAALERARGDWVLILDADEELPADQHARLQADLANNRAVALRLPLVNAGLDDGRSFVPRLFRNVPGAFFRGRIHEQIFASLLPHCQSWGMTLGLGTAQLVHHGYTPEMVRDRNKNERNLRLLNRAIEESPNDPNLVMNLGLELARAGDVAAGLARYREAFQLMSAQPAAGVVPELREVLLTQFVARLYQAREHEEILRVLRSPLAKRTALTASQHLALGLAQYELKNYRDAAEQMRQCLVKRTQPVFSPINPDILTALPHHCLALSLVRLGDHDGAEKAFLGAFEEKGQTEALRLDYARFLSSRNRPLEALHQLHAVVENNSKQCGAWRLGGEIALSRADFLEFAGDWTGEAIRYLPDDAVLIAQRAEALMLKRETANAFPLWERACNGARPAKALAAWVLCAAVESQPVPGIRNATEETNVSRAFVEWYRRLISVGAGETVMRLNSRLDRLKESLPTAARILTSALAEAEKETAKEAHG